MVCPCVPWLSSGVNRLEFLKKSHYLLCNPAGSTNRINQLKSSNADCLGLISGYIHDTPKILEEEREEKERINNTESLNSLLMGTFNVNKSSVQFGTVQLVLYCI